MLMINR